MDLIRIVEPTSEALSLKEVKDYLRIEHAEEDDQLVTMIMAATFEVEKYLNRSLLTQTWVLSLEKYPSGNITLFNGPVQSITTITSSLLDGSQDIFDNTQYFLANKQEKPIVSLEYGAIWPPNVLRPTEGVKIVYVCGHGDTSDDIPSSIRQALLHIVASLYENREDGPMISETVKSLLHGQKVYTFV